MSDNLFKEALNEEPLNKPPNKKSKSPKKRKKFSFKHETTKQQPELYDEQSELFSNTSEHLFPTEQNYKSGTEATQLYEPPNTEANQPYIEPNIESDNEEQLGYLEDFENMVRQEDNELFGEALQPISKQKKSDKPKVPLKQRLVNFKNKLFVHNQEEVEQEESAPEGDWQLISDTNANDIEMEETKDTVETQDIELGKVLKTKLDINQARTAELSVRDNIALTKMYMFQDMEEQEELDRQRAIEDKRVEHVQTLRDFLLTELSAYLTTYETEVVVQIDAKFGEYLEETLELLKLSYDYRVIPRNKDMLMIYPDLPYRCVFRIRPLGA